MKLRVVLCLIALFVIGLVSLAIAQRSPKNQDHKGMNHNASASAQSKTEDPPGTIDGAKNPELISDFKAYEVFFHSVVVADNAAEAEKLGAKDMFSRAQLSESDTVELMKVLGEFHKARSNIISQANQFSQNRASDSEFSQLSSQAESLISSTQQALKSAL